MMMQPSYPYEGNTAALLHDTSFHCDHWDVREIGLPQSQRIAVSESVFSVGNGLVGIRGYAEDTDSIGNFSFFTRTNNNSHAANSYDHSGGSSNAAGTSSRHTSRLNTPAPQTPPETPEETPGPEKTIRGSYFAGFYEQHLISGLDRLFSTGVCTKDCFLARVPDAFCIDVFIGGEHVNSTTGKIRSHTRRLDLHTGELRRRMVWYSEAQKREVCVESSRCVSTVRRNIAWTRFCVTATNVKNTDIRLFSRTEVPSASHPKRMYDVEETFSQQSLHTASNCMLVRTRNSCRHLAVATVQSCMLHVDEEVNHKTSTGGSDVSGAPSVEAAHSLLDASRSYGTQAGAAPTFLTPKCTENESGCGTLFTSCISEHITLELVKYIGYFGDDDAPQEELCDMAMHETHTAANIGFHDLEAEHRDKMNTFWEAADVKLRGNSEMQGAFRFNLLHMQAAGGVSSSFGFPSRGLTGEMLKGQMQWDVDTLVVPVFAHMYPERARVLLQFRINSLNQARDIARELNLPRGAVYPFRTISGSKSGTPNCSSSLFNNACIVYSMRQYVVANNDYTILQDGGAELVFCTALALLTWGSWVKEEFHIRCVSGPDEFNGVVNNHFFTNLMVQHHFQWAVQVATYMKDSFAGQWGGLLARCRMTEDDIVAMERAATAMHFVFDPAHRVYPVDEAFMRRKRWNLSDLNSQGKGDLLRKFHPTVIYRHRLCSLPDVMLAAVLLPEKFSVDEVRANFHFYEPITSHDSALKFAIFCVTASQIHLVEKASSYFTRAVMVDINNLLGSTSGGLHCTTAAGAWWGLAVGFAGMRVIQSVLHFDPRLPEKLDEYEIRVRHHGCCVKVHVTERVVTYTLVEVPPTDAKAELLLIHAGISRIRLTHGASETVHLLRKVRVFVFDAVIFEMSSLIKNIEDVHYGAWQSALDGFFQDNGYAEARLTKELYLRYLQFSLHQHQQGLNELLRKFDVPPLPIGHHRDPADARTIFGLCNRKLKVFQDHVQQHGLELREGIAPLLSNLRESNIAVGCCTFSRNGHWLLDQTLQLKVMFDHVLDGNLGAKSGLRWRPEMEYFTACAKGMEVDPRRAVVVLDGVDGFARNSLERFCMVLDTQLSSEPVPLEVPYLQIKDFSTVSVGMLDEHTVADGRSKAPMRSEHHAQSYMASEEYLDEAALSSW